jgi:transposase
MKLSKEQRSEIEADVFYGVPVDLVAKDFGVSVSTVYHIIHGYGQQNIETSHYDHRLSEGFAMLGEDYEG